MSLRASSENENFILYAFRSVGRCGCGGFRVEKQNEYVVSLEQQDGGIVRASQVGMVKHGTIVTLEAAPDRGNMFVKWEDGTPLNPYRYVVTDNCTLKGSFAASNMPVGNEKYRFPAVRICTTGSFLHIQSPEVSELSVWNLEGKLIKRAGVPAGLFVLSAAGRCVCGEGRKWRIGKDCNPMSYLFHLTKIIPIPLCLQKENTRYGKNQFKRNADKRTGDSQYANGPVHFRIFCARGCQCAC